MFNAPEIITRIVDIAQIYKINDAQCDDLDDAVELLWDNIYLDTMRENMIIKWENMLVITPLASDTIEDRRGRIKAKVLSPIPSTYRGVIKLISASLGDNKFSLIIDEGKSRICVLLHKTHRLKCDLVESVCEEIIPLDYTYYTEVDWNDHSFLSGFKHEDLSMFTHEELRYF